MAARPLIWITRTEPGASRTARAVKALGWSVLKAPLLRLKDMAPALDLTGLTPSAMIFTSPNAVLAWRRLILRSGRLSASLTSVRCICVGDATMRAARRAGFGNMLNAKGDGEAVFALVKQQIPPEGGRILHPANLDEGGRLAARLRADGYQVDWAPTYQTLPRLQPPRRVLSALSAGSQVIALIQSPKAARVLASFDRDASDREGDSRPLCSQLHALAGQSDAALAPLAGFKGPKCVAKTPDEPSLLLELAQFH
jgi:uroporphyrinogen-III synthase